MQAVYNIAEICARHGITDVVLSPGSRSAPLTLAFARHPELMVRVVPDERAAAFIGLGIAQAQRRAVALVCTSGTAGLNYAPAVAEAFFQHIPLVIFTADRPPEWIDQLDGQTIRQRNLYGAHAKGEFEFPVDTSHADAKWHSARIVNEAINLAQAAPAGPVQVNVPLREPFYPKAGEGIVYEKDVPVIWDNVSRYDNSITCSNAIREWPSHIPLPQKVLIVAGQHHKDEHLIKVLNQLADINGIAVVADTISNSTGSNNIVTGQDIIFSAAGKVLLESLQPDLLITFGKSLISKGLKIFLRNYPATVHWHIQADDAAVADTFRSLTHVYRNKPSLFLQEFDDLLKNNWRKFFRNYGQQWRDADQRAKEIRNRFLHAHLFGSFNEFRAFEDILMEIPGFCALHLANSMAVRYANILGLPQGRQIEVFANRGTSGIDGCNSTAVGAALAQPERPVVLLTGDVAFFYDRNAFWHNYPTPNLRVVLFNNHGGGIFRIIDGPRQQPELDEFFETRQLLTAENTAKDFNLRYFPVSSFAELEAALPVFFAAKTGAAILEVFTDSKTNAAFFEEYRSAVKAAFA
jgi:2-succinyl-5-enolpyruvyl-6-hydroxy-3-cyclohexene-1-carboxylate synthase